MARFTVTEVNPGTAMVLAMPPGYVLLLGDASTNRPLAGSLRREVRERLGGWSSENFSPREIVYDATAAVELASAVTTRMP